MMFSATTKFNDVEIDSDNCYKVPITDEVLTDTGWKKVKEVVVGDIILGDDDNKDVVKNISRNEDCFYLYV